VKIKTKEANQLRAGETVRWTDLKWYKIKEARTRHDGWTFLKLEEHGLPECSIYGNVELSYE